MTDERDYTTNLNLVLPKQSEQYNVDDFNDNFGKIDDFAGLVPARALTADELTTGAKINGVNFKGNTNVITGLGLHSSTEIYAQNNLAYKVIDDNVVVKRSLVNNNTGDNFDDSDYWEDVALGGGSGYQLFDIVMKDHVLSYEESLGLAPLGTYVYKEAIASTRYGYPDFYQKCVDEYNDLNNTTDTVDSVTVTINANGHKFYDIADKATFDNMYAITGEAWYYGIDTTNERVFLPRSTRFKNGTTSDVGRYQPAGLPNITGSIVTSGAILYTETGCFYPSDVYVNRDDRLDVQGNAVLHFDASRSSSIYGASDTVEYASTKLIPYMVVGNVANESAVTDVVDITTSENDTLPLGFSTYQGEGTQPSPAWLKSNGQWNSGEVYTTFYHYYVTKIGDDFGVGKVVENTDPYTDYDLVINQTEQTFRLPLYNGQESMFADKVKGNGMALGLQNSDGTDCVLFSQPNDYNRCSNGMPTGATAPVAMTNTETTSWAGIGGIKGVSTDSVKSGLMVDTENITIPDGMALFYKVANAVQNLELLDAGAVLTAVNNVSAKVDNTIHIIETYENGSSGYIVYSNGLCEQWGIRASGAGVQTLFIKTYKDKNYNLLCEPVGQSGQVQNARPMEYNKQPDGFYSYYSDTYYSINWRTCGYLAEGQY